MLFAPRVCFNVRITGWVATRSQEPPTLVGEQPLVRESRLAPVSTGAVVY